MVISRVPLPQSNDSNPSLRFTWTGRFTYFFVISSPPLICGTVEVPNKTWKSAEQILLNFHWLWLQKWIFQRLLKIMVTWVPSLSIVNWKLHLMRTWSADSTHVWFFFFFSLFYIIYIYIYIFFFKQIDLPMNESLAL